MKKKDTIIIIIITILFGAASIYLLFINTSNRKYDSKIRAYQINLNERKDSDGDSVYSPTYHFKVKRKDYTCETKFSSSIYPNEKKNIVYYNSSNPNKCMTEYDKTTRRIIGYICLFITCVLIIVLRKPTNKESTNHIEEIDPEKQYQIEENAQKAFETMKKIQLIIKRIILGIIIVILLIIIAFNTILLKQTIKAKNYIDTIAEYVDIKESDEISSFTDYIYTFKDKKDMDQEIVISLPNSEYPKNEINIKYDENNPQEFYEDGSTMDKKSIIIYGLEVVLLVFCIFVFFNKKIINKIGLSVSSE